MGEKFKRIKFKYLLGALLKSAICGISFALVVVGIVLISLKQSAITLDTMWYILIGVGALLVGGGIAFIFFMPTNKKVAARLDSEFGLDERVQTALAYQGMEGTVLELQRDDTKATLKNLPKGKFKWVSFLEFCGVAVLAVAIAVTAILIPTREIVAANPNEDDEPAAAADETDVQKLNELIRHVNNSKLDTTLKQNIVVELTELLDIASAVWEEELIMPETEYKNAVIQTIEDVEAVINDWLVFDDFAALLDYPELADAILAGGNAYRVYEIKSTKNYDSYILSKTMDDAVNKKVSAKTAVVYDSLKVETGFSTQMMSVYTTLAFAIANDTDLYKEYSSTTLFKSVQTLVLGDTAKNIPGLTSLLFVADFESAKESLDIMFATLNDSLKVELDTQSDAGAMRRCVRNVLADIFDLPDQIEEKDEEEREPGDSQGSNDEEKPPVQPDDTDVPPPPDGNDYEGNDLIYINGGYVPYTQVLEDYRKKLEQHVADGLMSQELADMCFDYFQSFIKSLL